MNDYVTLDYNYLMHRVEEEVRKAICEISTAGNEAGINQCVQYANGVLAMLDLMSLATEGSYEESNFLEIREYLNKARTDVTREDVKAKAKIHGYNA